LKAVKQCVETSEGFADGVVTEQELDAAHRKGIIAFTEAVHRSLTKLDDATYMTKLDRMGISVDLTPNPLPIAKVHELVGEEHLKPCGVPLLRCIFGNLSRPVTLDPTCLTSTVKQLAESIYQDRAFDRLPILADALEESGCRQEEVLKHLRSRGEHVRGCWALDLVTGRE
jgi:hypothetical protein